MTSPKYNRTFHLPWSEGCTSEDKRASDVKSLLKIEIVITEKMDGSNASLERDGCFARTHVGPPTHTSFDGMKALHAAVGFKIPNSYQLFGEWVYAKHSITYDKLPGYFLLFNVRENHVMEEVGHKLFIETARWSPWDDVELWAEEIGVPTVPVLFRGKVSTANELREITEKLMREPSLYGDVREGVVIRDAGQFGDDDFSHSVMKFVRKDHVQTGDHWSHKEIVKNKLK